LQSENAAVVQHHYLFFSLEIGMATIYVSEAIHPDVLKDIKASATLLVGFGPDAVVYEDIANQVDAVMLRSEKFPASRINMSSRLKIIARHGVGVDTVDVNTATQNGILVTYCPGGNSNAVAEHVFALLLCLVRKVGAGHENLVGGTWPRAKQHLVGEELFGGTLGIVGFGEIGKNVCRIAKGFGMNLLVSDPFIKSADIEACGARHVVLAELLAHSKFVSLHAPLVEATKHLINRQTIAQLKPGAFLVNTARSGLVDEDALAEALIEGHIGGAALDVIYAEQEISEPVRFGGRVVADIPNLLVTPHIAGQTTQSLKNVGTTAWTDIQATLSGGVPHHPFNTPINRR
jgi:D-3-phosphoglycerate dehydrogenase / 2-oxoglutarate reductase